MIRDLSAFRRSRVAPAQIRDRAEGQDADKGQLHEGAMFAHVRHRAAAVFNRENSQNQIPHPATDGDGGRKASGVDAGDARKEHEDLKGEWSSPPLRPR